ncbi:MAG TPA: thrombospondin type 3 repeat-containing protein, partial [Fibrobacteraceae bacterium]|nr:thrombospondin type 3 repeat-containing protein [Fibrobacteraceae bacterium]
MHRSPPSPNWKKLGFCVGGFGVALALSNCAGLSDHDHDGIPDKVDACPLSAEDIDAYLDNDGCPDFDNDRDGIPDVKDRCPVDAEDKDGFEDSDGCPDLDNDKDGILDLQDRCPFTPEDKDGFEDADGCPDLDNDGDGIVDSLDQCPMAPEDHDGFEDTDGCPDLDNDGDGIKDDADKCPMEPETFNQQKDDDGCPDLEVEVLPEQLELPLQFIETSAELTEADQELLSRIVPSLAAHPEHRVYVYVFMPKGDLEEKAYLDLLNQRTQSISAYFSSAGVTAGQVRTRTVTEELFHAQE